MDALDKRREGGGAKHRVGGACPKGSVNGANGVGELELEAGELPLDVEGAEGQEIRSWAWDPGSRRTVG